MKDMKETYVYLKLKDKFVKFMKLSFHSHIDGSLYISLFTNISEGVLKLSYHSTGRLNYQIGLFRHTIFVEPIYEIRNPFCILKYHLEECKVGNENNAKVKDEDFIIDLSDYPILTTSFQIRITPTNYSVYDLNINELARIKFNKLFDLIILNMTGEQQDEYEFNEFGLILPNVGFFDKQRIDKYSALIKFHEKITDSVDIIYTPNTEGDWKIIHSVPMRISPRLTVRFKNSSFTAHKLENESSIAITKFIVKDAFNNKVKDIVAIENIELDSEL